MTIVSTMVIIVVRSIIVMTVIVFTAATKEVSVIILNLEYYRD